jgi:hypothetical protein
MDSRYANSLSPSIAPEPEEISQYSDCLRTGWPKGRRLSPARNKVFLLSTLSRPVVGPTQPLIQRVPGTVYPGLKRPGREADQSPPSNADVKNSEVIRPLHHVSSWYRA